MVEIIKEDRWFLNFRDVINSNYCNSFRASDDSPEDFRDVDWDTYSYNSAECPNLNYTRLDIVINQRY
jgi:hypothetical protein